MPQFDLAVFLPQIFWLVICFTGLYAFTVGYSVPRLRKAYDERWQHIEGTRIEAVKIQRQAQDLTAAYEKELEDARKKASEHVNAGLRQISQETTDEKNAILIEMKKRFMKGELIVAERKMDGFVESQHIAQMLSAEIIQKLMHEHLSAKSVKGLVTQSFKQKAANAH